MGVDLAGKKTIKYINVEKKDDEQFCACQVEKFMAREKFYENKDLPDKCSYKLEHIVLYEQENKKKS